MLIEFVYKHLILHTSLCMLLHDAQYSSMQTGGIFDQ